MFAGSKFIDSFAVADTGNTAAEVDSTWLGLGKDIFGGSKSFDLLELKYPFSNIF